MDQPPVLTSHILVQDFGGVSLLQDAGPQNFIKALNVQKVKVPLSCLTLCDPMDCSPPGSTSMGFSRQEYWSGLPLASPGDLPDPGTEPRSPALEADALTSEPPGKPTPFIVTIKYCLCSPYCTTSPCSFLYPVVCTSCSPPPSPLPSGDL